MARQKIGPEAQRPVATTRHLTACQVCTGVEFFEISSSEEVSWLAWCSFSLRASNRLHFSTTFRLGCGGGLILAGEGVFDEISTTRALLWAPVQAVYRGQKASLVRLGLCHWGQPDGLHPLGATSNRCPGPTTHRLPRAVFDAEDPLEMRPLSPSHCPEVHKQLKERDGDLNCHVAYGKCLGEKVLSLSRFAILLDASAMNMILHAVMCIAEDRSMKLKQPEMKLLKVLQYIMFCEVLSCVLS